MTPAFDTWESYFYPHPDDGTMRNLEGIRNPHELGEFEFAATDLRRIELAVGLVDIPRTYDAAHL